MKATTLLIALLAPLALAAAVAAGADGGCIITPTGIDCSAEGTSSTSGGTPGTTIPGVPLRYLATTEHPDTGLCWFWSPYPPGLDSWDSAHDMKILWTLWALPECPDPTLPLVVPGDSWIEARAWEVFRSFPLAAPRPTLQPGRHGITGLPSFLSAPLPATLDHRETLPDSRLLQVEAEVATAVVDWGDGTPAIAYDPEALLPYPHGQARHTYALKTCPAAYRASHPSGGNCHPRLEAYPITVTFRWTARYRLGKGWHDLGHLDRTTTVAYDVDEVIGVLRP
ncbi:MAG: hypothetical protein JW785_01570 [Acidimicrobiia bacterium]|nr:hypothetical protein [Acidimicrobiia bacterium]